MNQTKDQYIRRISEMSDRYGNRLVELMDRYGHINLQQVTEDEAKEFYEEISTKN
ncbi:MAG: hypothetical protein ACOX0U_04355 [Oscillospiraceae bacterium]